MFWFVLPTDQQLISFHDEHSSATRKTNFWFWFWKATISRFGNAKFPFSTFFLLSVILVSNNLLLRILKSENKGDLKKSCKHKEASSLDRIKMTKNRLEFDWFSSLLIFQSCSPISIICIRSAWFGQVNNPQHECYYRDNFLGEYLTPLLASSLATPSLSCNIIYEWPLFIYQNVQQNKCRQEPACT